MVVCSFLFNGYQVMYYQFGEFVLDTVLFELRGNNRSIKIEPQVLEILVLLVKNPDRLVSKQEIYDSIWSGRYVSEAALSSRIKSVRQVLGDTGQEQRFIRTVYKKGFRFVAEVQMFETLPGRDPCMDGQSSIPISEVPESNQPHVWRPTIAVLPFSNLSNQIEQEYFTDGITTDIITMLSKHRWLNVVARNTTFSYKGRSLNMQTLGQEISADYIVEGSVQRFGDRVRISTHLIDTSTCLHKWAEKYDREVTDIFALQDDITEKIVARLEPEIGLAERHKVIISRPANLQAWDCFHLGLYHFYKFTGKDNLEAQHLLLRSQNLDARFADAYAWWAYAVVLGMVYWDVPPTQQLLDEALMASDKSLSIDSNNATFYALRARVHLARREYAQAIQENEIAISLNPTFAAAHCGLGDSLAYEGRYDEAIECFEKAITMSPNDPQLWAFLTYGALVSLFTHDYEKALSWCDRAQSIPNCQYWTKSHKVVALAYTGRLAEAHKVSQLLLREMPEFSLSFVRDKLFYLKQKDQIELYMNGLSLAGVPNESASLHPVT